MNPALNLIGFNGLVGTGSGSKTAAAVKTGRGSTQVDFASLLKYKLQGGTGKGRTTESSGTSSARTDQVASQAAAASNAVNVDPAGGPPAADQTVSTSGETAAKGSETQKVDPEGIGEKPAGTDTKLEAESDNGLDSLLESDPELKEILTLLAQLMTLLENQVSQEVSGTDEAATRVGEMGKTGRNDLLQLLASMLQGKAVDGDGAVTTAQAAIPELKEFAKLLESIQAMTVGEKGGGTAAGQTASSQTETTVNLQDQSEAKADPAPTVLKLIERLEEALQRWEAKDQGRDAPNASKSVTGEPARKVENLVRGILQMVKAAEVVNKTAASEPAAPMVTDSSAETDAVVVNPVTTASDGEPTQSGGESAKQSTAQQNGASRDTGIESKAFKVKAADESAESPEQAPKAASQTQEQKPAAVVPNQVSGPLEQRVNDTPLTQDAETKPQQVLKPIIEGMRLVQRESRTEMSIQLQPESLGKLNLKVSVENGLVTAKLVAESQSVGRLIESSLGQLKQSLQEQGLRFDRIEVSVGDTSAQADLSQQFSRQYQNQSWGNQSPQISYSGGVESDWTYQPVESSGVTTSYSSESQYDFLA